MTKKRLIIHAGLGKSGSSAIQKYLNDQAKTLEQNGFVYLGMFLERPQPSEHDFSSASELESLLTSQADQEALQRIGFLIAAKAALRPQARAFIWSHIGLATVADRMRPLIEGLKGEFDISVILYFRHQVNWLTSAYYQWGLKHKTYEGSMRSFEHFLPALKSRGSDYRSVISGWRDAVGVANVEVRSYDLCDDVVQDFAGLLDIGDGVTQIPRRRHYVTPDHHIHTLFKLWQGQSDKLGLPAGLQTLLARNKIVDKHYRSVDPAIDIPAGNARKAWIRSFDEENDALERDFGLRLVARDDDAYDDHRSAPAALVPILLDILIAMDARIDKLEKRLKTVNGASA